MEKLTNFTTTYFPWYSTPSKGAVYEWIHNSSKTTSIEVARVESTHNIITIQQQQDPQPRERDYFYTGSFMMWCMWIGIGVYSLINNLSKKKVQSGIAIGIVAVSTI